MTNMEPASSQSIDRLVTQIRQLRWLVLALGIVLAAVILWTVLRPAPKVLTAERLEIVEPDGMPAIVLANSRRVPLATLDGQVIMSDQGDERVVPGMIFFDGRGDEVGGMLFGVAELEDGSSFAGRHFSLDGWKQDQTVQLYHFQTGGRASAGLNINDRPLSMSILDAAAELGLEPGYTRAELNTAIEALPEDGREARLNELFGTGRINVASHYDRTAAVTLRDGQGRPRLRLQVEEDGAAAIEFLDHSGEVAHRLPE